MNAKEVMPKFDYVILWLVNRFGKVLTWVYDKLVDPIECMYAKKYGGEFIIDVGNGIKIIE